MKDLCLHYNPQKALQFLSQRRDIWNCGYAQKAAAQDVPLYWTLGVIMASTWYVVKQLYGLELLKQAKTNDIKNG